MHFFLILLLILINVIAADIEPIDEESGVDFAKARLGKKLFFDPILSKDGTVACVSCHILPGSGADFRAVSLGIDSKKGSMNSPTVLNARYNFVQFWNGRAKTLEEQILGPIHNNVEMGESIDNVLSKLNDSAYKDEFKFVYKEGLNKENFLDAIAEFEKALITPDSPFDRYLKGEQDAMSDSAKRGYAFFIDKGCISCHNGKNIGGNMYQKFGNIIEFSTAQSSLDRYSVTKNIDDKNYFKVPTLRNVALSAPYFHDGRALTLKEAIVDMAEHQVGIVLTNDEINDIEEFLISLTGQSPKILED